MPDARRLRLSDFTPDAATGLRLAPEGGVPAGYLDGAERELVEALEGISDRSVASAELGPLMHDWPTRYHLSPFRTTIFDCLELDGEPAKVLELGAGCGAITRWLGEHCAEVHAIEGNPARASVVRTRCADLDNVHVYVGNYSELDEQASFDVVTLIGVLEYSHLYHPTLGHDPAGAARSNLELARRTLREDGVLVLAIENRLGLKYLNGAREDHTGQPFDGVHGYPDPAASAVTFNVRELEGLLRSAGFGASELLYPYPDYKLASTVLNLERLDPDDHIHNWLDGAAPDRGAERGPLSFNEVLATREFARAGLLREVANSFLVLAWPDEAARRSARLGVQRGWRARHYSLDRRPCFRKSVTLAGDRVEHRALVTGPHADARVVEEALGLSQTLGEERFQRGDLVLLEAFEAVAAEGLGERFTGLIRRTRRWLLESYAVEAAAAPSELPLVRGEAYDAVWWNLVVDPETGGWEPIDREWSVHQALPVDYILWRILFHFCFRYAAMLPGPDREVPPTDFADTWLVRAVPDSPDWVRGLSRELDLAFGSAVVPGPLPAGRPAALTTLAELDAPAPAFTVLAMADEIAAHPELLAAYAACFGPDDPATLVLYAPDGDAAAVTSAIESAIRTAGLSDDGLPDLVIVPIAQEPEQERLMAATMAAVLSERRLPPVFAGLPRYGAAQALELRALADSA